MEKRAKTGGRAKGTPNKTTAETKQLLQNVVTKQIEKLETTLSKLEPVDRVNALSKLLPYILPKQQDIAITNTNEMLTESQRDQRIQELKNKLLEP
ncbi:hypothetical protein [Flavobacterium sp.]|uniref:hypothetical protein n=1 Tax=Flavobacterium sp. TaxID=239 RepID=UPI0035B12422